MKVPFSWLKEYVDVGRMSPEEVAQRLTIAGLEVVLIEKVGADSIFDIEVTPNRPDCLSILGIAREVAACLGKRLKPPKIKSIEGRINERPSIEIRDNKLCLRYTGRIIRNVRVGSSPKWLAGKVKAMGLRPVNNIADITNYCLFELGQPTHAFDYDKIRGRIIVRRARDGEKMVTIDRKERALDKDMLVIADEEKAVALGGVMGSKDTEVTDKTKNILFESAYFNPVSIRRTSRRLGLISESSYRFERSVDMGGIVGASDRACNLITELCGGEAGPLRDAGKKDPKPVKIYLRPERLKDILGLEISVSAIKKVLSSLELKVNPSGKKTMVVSVPSFRQDLKGEVDLIEEVVRIYGYDRLPSTMPTIVGHPRRMDLSREITDTIKDALISLGLDEVITYSLISKEDLRSVEEIREDRIIVIENPLSIEQEIMRPTLAPSILDAVSWNLNRGIKNLRIFELGKVYVKDAKGFKEKDNLSMAFAGERPYDWRRKEGSGFFEAKGVLEELFDRLEIEKVSFGDVDLPLFLSGDATSIWVGKEKIGFLGKVDRKTLDRFDIKTDIVLCEISLERLFGRVRLEKRFRPLPRFPSSLRDISMVVKKGVFHQEIVSTIKEAGGELVADIELFDQYFGMQIQEGTRGLAYSIEYRAKDRTLTDQEVNRLHTQVCDALVEKLDVRIR